MRWRLLTVLMVLVWLLMIFSIMLVPAFHWFAAVVAALFAIFVLLIYFNERIMGLVKR